MENRFKRMKLYLILTTLIIDLLFTGALYLFFNQIRVRSGIWPLIVSAAVTVLFVWLISGVKYETGVRDPRLLKKFYFIATLFLLIYLPKIFFIVFFLVNKLIILVQRGVLAVLSLFDKNTLHVVPLSVITFTGIALGGLLFLFLLYGMVIGRFNYKIERINLSFANLPGKFDNYRIVQISDIHLGTIPDKKRQIKRAIKMVNRLNPDLILFTGDLVNNYSEEALGWPDVFRELNPEIKKYSVLGNHDYGDYWDWKSAGEKKENMELLFRIEKEMGFRLLLNESETISIDGQEIGITGVQNWGKPPFHQFGDLSMALNGAKSVPFRILLSHDPSHWEKVVRKNDSVDLTFSGHTHGMQFGIKIGDFQWSPVQYIYKYWAGLYENEGRYLYVNRGLGHIGYLGRAGMRPEITLITLKSGN